MSLSLLCMLLGFPLLVAALICFARKSALFPVLIYPAATLLILATLGLLFTGANHTPLFFRVHLAWIEPAMLLAEVAVAAYLLYLAVQRRDWVVSLFVVVQTLALLVFHFGPGKAIDAEHNLFLDQFSLMMGLIIGVIGGLITIYAVGYMQDFHHHHPEVKDRRGVFFGLIFLFLSAMFGVCFSNNLLWLFFCWEITTVCSFLLIRYKLDDQSVRNAFWALRWNLLGGLAFLAGIIYLYQTAGTVELDRMLQQSKALVLLPAALLSFAGLTKSAQLPFSSWLVGAMVAPTPVSALLHSSTMVKAGVYLVLRFAAVMQDTVLGVLVALVGAITFLIGSFICVSQNDAKKVLAYSTIANLGLIILCAGIGSHEAVWAGMLLIIFHAISKGLLFLCVGSIEHQTGSRLIEAMTGLVLRMPRVATMVMIGIAGMFLAPFGMLISKWVALRAVIEVNPLLAIILIYGSAATLFFWVKWLGKLLIVDQPYTPDETTVTRGQWLVLGALAAGTFLMCGFFVPVGRYLLEPYLQHIYGEGMDLEAGNVMIMGIMLSMMCLFALSFLFHGRRSKVVGAYLGGANLADSRTRFTGSLGQAQDMTLKNYYLEGVFGEAGLMRLGVGLGILLAAAVVAAGAFLCIS